MEIGCPPNIISIFYIVDLSTFSFFFSFFLMWKICIYAVFFFKHGNVLKIQELLQHINQNETEHSNFLKYLFHSMGQQLLIFQMLRKMGNLQK